ncbi:MAG: hypothetical protein KC442_03265, partial [Thermomicrobiales bacterium]|nr:hypothetical protein [Thermomicrobiales bacterium]
NRNEEQAELRRTFETGPLLGVQDALVALMETTRAGRVKARATTYWVPPARTPEIEDLLHTHEATLWRHLVLLHEDALRVQAEAAADTLLAASMAPTAAESDAAWASARQQLRDVNARIGEQVRAITLRNH